jgi:hypothetical protein
MHKGEREREREKRDNESFLCLTSTKCWNEIVIYEDILIV